MKHNKLTLGSLVLVVVIFAFGCEKVQVGPSEESSMEVAGQAADEVGGAEIPPPTTPGTVATIAIGGKATFSVEIAETDEERSRGLMGRESLPPNFGMWFVFPQETTDSFWMKDTLVPLDIIYVDENMEVVHINPNTVPGSTKLLYSPELYLYVLEVSAGTTEEHDIKTGDVVVKRIGP